MKSDKKDDHDLNLHFLMHLMLFEGNHLQFTYTVSKKLRSFLCFCMKKMKKDFIYFRTDLMAVIIRILVL